MEDTRNALCDINHLWSIDIGSYSEFTENLTAAEIPGHRRSIAPDPLITSTLGPTGSGNGGCWGGSFVDVVLVPTICALGVLGNVLTLVILSRRRLAVVCDSSEQTVHVGLRALALSDLLVCLCQLPQGFIDRGCFVYSSRTFQLFYWTYSGALINTFLMSSAWLIVTMAIGRYLTTAYPFRFRALVGIASARVSAGAVFVASFLINLPRLFEYRIETIVCRRLADDEIGPANLSIATMTSSSSSSSSTSAAAATTTTAASTSSTTGEQGVFEIYMQVPGWLRTVDHHAENAYLWIYFGFGVCIPLTLLLVGNCGLVVAVRRSSRLARRYRVSRTHVDAHDRVTSVLISVVIAYLLLVTPAEILMFVERRLLEDRQLTSINRVAIALNIANLLQTINFSFNFVLYISLNQQFRRALRDLIFSCWTRCRGEESTSAVGGVPMSTSTSLPQESFCCCLCSPSPPKITRRVNFSRPVKAPQTPLQIL